MPLPPLNEQRRIVAAIEEHLSRLDAADASLDAAVRATCGAVKAAGRADAQWLGIDASRSFALPRLRRSCPSGSGDSSEAEFRRCDAGCRGQAGFAGYRQLDVGRGRVRHPDQATCSLRGRRRLTVGNSACGVGSSTVPPEPRVCLSQGHGAHCVPATPVAGVPCTGAESLARRKGGEGRRSEARTRTSIYGTSGAAGSRVPPARRAASDRRLRLRLRFRQSRRCRPRIEGAQRRRRRSAQVDPRACLPGELVPQDPRRARICAPRTHPRRTGRAAPAPRRRRVSA